MKTKHIIIVIILLVIVVFSTQNNKRIQNTLLTIINPIKQQYKNLTQDIEDKSQSYIFQKESIEKLSRENRILRKRLLEQIHYIQQIRDLYAVLPDLSKLPIRNISIIETISYVKLNSFSQIILTKPKNLEENKLYGIIQEKVVAGVAQVRNNQLYGYLTSDDKCRFSVFIGKNNAPGIASGLKNNEMRIKFIPKWHKIKVGDNVITSGLDDIFFANIPVGIVTKIEIESSYKVAYIHTFSDIYHPKTFFLINNAKATIIEGFDSDSTQLKPYTAPLSNEEENTTKVLPSVSSIPSRIDQTQNDVVQPAALIKEILPIAKKKKYKKSKKVKKTKKTKKVKKTKPIVEKKITQSKIIQKIAPVNTLQTVKTYKKKLKRKKTKKKKFRKKKHRNKKTRKQKSRKKKSRNKQSKRKSTKKVKTNTLDLF